MREKDNGYQEFYLLNGDKIKVASKEVEYGGTSKKTSWGTETFEWTVNGASCSETMYLQYGAHGDDEDDFYIRHVEIEIVAVRIYDPLSQTITYDSGYSVKEIDATYIDKHDTFSIAGFREFFTSEYELTFTITLTMWEKEDGYQEVYLVDETDATVAEKRDIEYGGSKKLSKKGTEVITLIVFGDQCTETMGLKYSAHGKDSDDWCRAQAKVEVTVRKR